MVVGWVDIDDMPDKGDAADIDADSVVRKILDAGRSSRRRRRSRRQSGSVSPSRNPLATIRRTTKYPQRDIPTGCSRATPTD